MGRGWQLVRKHWRSYLLHREDVLGRVTNQVESLTHPTVDENGEHCDPKTCLSREAANRAVDYMINHMQKKSTPSTFDSLKQMQTWGKANDLNHDLRKDLSKLGWKPNILQAAKRPAGPRSLPAAAQLMPAAWCAILTPDLVADLVVEAFSSTFVDAFLDGAILLLEQQQQQQSRQSSSTGFSSSSSSLQSESRTMDRTQHVPQALPFPQVWRPLPSADDRTNNFLTSPKGEKPWTTRRIHSSTSLLPLTTRIQQHATDQRPQRNLRRAPEDPLAPKFSYPMLAHNFPEKWASTTSRPSDPGRPRSREAQTMPPHEDIWLQRKGSDGKTIFPYSLVSHKAFLDSQSDPILKQKALKVVPLRMTTQW